MDILSIIADVLATHEEIVTAYIYGSMVKGYADEASDIDVGLVLRRGFEPDPLYSARLANELEKRLNSKHEVDVRVLNGQSTRFVYQVIKEGKVVFCRNEEERVEFETNITKIYLDIKPLHEEYDRVRRQRIIASY
ncbi:MAG: nucleotidyltransferase domain-containing protein [Candidatus Freyarchaeota archaeon]|nr:nucleotidyltransferase domain-containing protein [Candidatus Jordarchaeia archaeon]MBS7270424.1 nucleotidyltransferase domain-containing protein [Candidatus Jordarchaeia archaeon]MBS7281214.1 nucleotidyltransferase domain-containing protein [Candidatus Jordarchaeia archaeon]